MSVRLKIAFRNICRHRGRTVVSLLMVAGSAIGQIQFAGFASYILANTQRIMIDNQYGHIQIAEWDHWNLTPGKRMNQLMSGFHDLKKTLQELPGVESVSERLTFFGLLSSGEITTSAKGIGYDPEKEVHFNKNLEITEGKGLTSRTEASTIVGNGLRKKINAKVGDTITVLSYTLDGVVNAVDLKINGIFTTHNAEVDEYLFMVPIQATQTLLDTERVEILSIRLLDTKKTNAIRPLIDEVTQKYKSSLKSKTWYELSEFYRQVEKFFQAQNRIIELILLSIVFLGVMNTVGMSVHERTGEIGTLRALGEKPRSIVMQFLTEGLMLGFLGAMIGMVGGWLLAKFVSGLSLTMQMPGTSSPVPIEIDIVPLAFLQAFLVAMLASGLATWWPAHRATKISVVEALRRNV